MTTQFLIDDLKSDEGCRLKAYQDTLGIWTVGVGHAHVSPDTVWTQSQADEQLARDIETAEHCLDDGAPWWKSLNDARQDVLVNMTFNMGWATLCGFHFFLAAAKAGDYDAAAHHMLNSKWAAQVHSRATRLAEQMRTGVRT